MKPASFLARTSFLLSAFFALDKALALAKSVVFNRLVGLEGMGIFGAANNIPDLLSALLSGGALGVALIPVLRETMDKSGRATAWRLFSKVVNLAFILTGVAALGLIVAAPVLVPTVVAPGFDSVAQAQTTALMRLDLGAIVIFSVSGLVMAGLQANQHFLSPAAAPLLYNLGQIFGVTVLSPRAGMQVGALTLPAFGLGLSGMAYGVIIGAALHLAIQLPALFKAGFRWDPSLGITTPEMQKVLGLLGPRVLTMLCIQAYFLSRDNIASRFGTGAVGALNLGWTIEQVLETVIGTAIAVAILPTLATLFDQNREAELTSLVNKALRITAALAIPGTLLLGAATPVLVTTVFSYPAEQVQLVTLCTWAFLCGLVGDAWLEIAVRTHYAKLDTRTPLIAAAVQAISFMALSYLLSMLLGPAGIPLAAALTFTAQALVLLLRLRRQHAGMLMLNGSVWHGLLAGALGLAIYFPISYLARQHGILASAGALIAGAGAALLALRHELALIRDL